LELEGSLPEAKSPSQDSCAGLVGSEFGAGGIFAAGKNPWSV